MAARLAMALLLLATSSLSQAAEFTVGENSGWTFQFNYAQWAGSKTFRVGDTLSFPFTSVHNVVEVSKADYDRCDSSKAIQTYSAGNPIKVTLSRPGEHWFVCGIPGHCDAGMKLPVNVVAAASPAPASPPPPTRSGRKAHTPASSPAPAPAPSHSPRSASHPPAASPSVPPSHSRGTSPSPAPLSSSPPPSTPSPTSSAPTEGTTPGISLPPSVGAPPPSAALPRSSLSWLAAAAAAGSIMFFF